ncbi:MAG: hypothetical protein ACRDCE_18030 [Cetobacterium sp.]|uniref:hypothetical protein n=1 Tax=Cetobacterium sp. TaxID=2071632 RepID=UPI003EE72393
MLTMKDIDVMRGIHYESVSGDAGTKNKKVLDLVSDSIIRNIRDEEINEIRPLLNEEGFKYVKNLIDAYQSKDTYRILKATNGV